jgi:hypothetical protein
MSAVTIDIDGCSYKIWLYAGNSEYPLLPPKIRVVKIHLVQTIRRKDSDKVYLSMTNQLSNKWLKQIPREVGYYLSGFVDGEGSFNVSMRKRDDHTLGWQIVLSFNVSQRDITVLSLLKRHLGCGRLQERSDGVWYYIVSNPQAIEKRVIPFFEQFNFLSSSKKTNFSLFRKISLLMVEGRHLTEEGMQEILLLREQLNKGRGRKRKYSLKDYQRSLSENPQRLYAKVRSRSKRPDKI